MTGIRSLFIIGALVFGSSLAQAKSLGCTLTYLDEDLTERSVSEAVEYDKSGNAKLFLQAGGFEAVVTKSGALTGQLVYGDNVVKGLTLLRASETPLLVSYETAGQLTPNATLECIAE